MTSVHASDVGFVAAGFQDGSIVVIDLRGPAVIYDHNLQDLHGKSRRKQSVAGQEWGTVIEFGVMSLEGEGECCNLSHYGTDNPDYSSILFFMGTNLGRVATFKLLPEQSGGYAVHFAGMTTLDNKIISLCPLNVENGEPALATQDAVASLRNGARVNGVLLAIAEQGARIFRPATAKGAHKSWDDFICYSANVCRYATSMLIGIADHQIRIAYIRTCGHLRRRYD